MENKTSTKQKATTRKKTEKQVESKPVVSSQKTDETILVVIPYRGSCAQGREIELAIYGWRKYFRENYKLIIIGEDLPFHLQDDKVTCVTSRRVEPVIGMYRQHLDYVNCFRKVREMFPDNNGFIFAADDNYPVRDFTLEDIKKPKINALEINHDQNAEIFGWNNDKNRTLELLKREGLGTRNYTTHFPCWFEFDKLIALYDKYDMDCNSYVIEDLYFNTYVPEEEPVLLNNDTDCYRFMISNRKQCTAQSMSNAFRNKKFVCNTVDGWSLTMEGFLHQRYFGYHEGE